MKTVYKSYQAYTREKVHNITQKYLPQFRNYGWLRYVTMAWTLRMSFMAISFIFPILSAFTLGRSDRDLHAYNISVTTWNQQSEVLGDALSLAIPAVFVDVPVARADTVGNVLAMELPSILSGVKTSSSPLFTHFSSDRAWSEHFTNSMGHSIQNMDLRSFMDHRADLTDPVHVYLTRRLRNPDTNPIVQEIAPMLTSSLPALKGVESEISLWISSGNTTATTHYDMEHNFFLQVNGTKKFLISSPHHYAMFRPFSALHPRWRQAQTTFLTTPDSIRTQMDAASVRKEHGDKSCGRCSGGDGVCPSSGDDDRQQHGVRIVEVGSGIHEVELRAGQMLYLPPLFFHSVTTADPYSISINSWIGSKYLTAANKLSASVQLPYSPDADEAARMTAIGALINMVLIRLGKRFSASEFSSSLQSRVEGIRFDKETTELCGNPDSFDCNGTYPFSACSDRSIAVAEQRQRVRQTADRIVNIIENFSAAAQRIILLDYMEEVLDISLDADSTPQLFECFAQRCVVKHTEIRF